MDTGFSTCGCWGSLQDLKEIEIEDRGNPWFDDSHLDIENTEAIWVFLDPRNAPEYLTLTIGSETEEYLFRIMAIKIIHTNPERYGFVLEEQDYYQPYDAVEVEVSVPTLLHMQIIAEAAQTNFRTIKELNPDLRGYYLPTGKHSLLIPRAGVADFAQRLSASLEKASHSIKSTYVVKEGDSLSGIAKRLQVPLPELMRWNNITKADMVRVGQKLIYFSPEGR